MAKNNRRKPSLNLPIVRNLADADSTLGRIAALDRALKLLETGMNEEIAAIMLKTEREAEPLRQEMLDLETALARYGEENKDLLFTDKERSRKLSFGVIGYRFSSELDTIGNTSWAKVAQLIQDQGLDEKYIRHKPEVNKEALKRADDKTLKAVRCKIREKDEFYYETTNYELAESGGGSGRAA